MRVWPGSPYPLGATWDGVGVNFALFSEHATRVELCLFDSPHAESESLTIPLTEQTDMVWHGYLPDVRPGPALRLPGARALQPAPRPSLQSQQGRHGSIRAGGRRAPCDGTRRCSASARARTTRRSTRATAPPYAPLAAVVDSAFTWGGDRPLRTPWHETLIYELHVKGFTALHPDIPETLRGTYLGLASEPAIHHLVSLGVTAVELMPVHHHADDWHLAQRGLQNYWGYNTLSLFRARLALRGVGRRRSSRCASSR